MARTMATKGSKLYIADTSVTPVKVYGICATEVELNNGEPTTIDVTPLCETEKTQEVDGLLGSSTSTFTVNFDDESDVHKFLNEAQDKRELNFAFAWSNDPGEPEWDETTGAWKDLPTRTVSVFTGSLQPFSISAAVNAVFQIQMSIKMSNKLTTLTKA